VLVEKKEQAGVAGRRGGVAQLLMVKIKLCSEGTRLEDLRLTFGVGGSEEYE
jgi:hypothetical protein